MPEDPSNGYEAHAEEFMRARSSVGVDVVRAWAKRLPRGGSVIDIGAASGEPLTAVLIEEGLDVSAIDASQKMVAAFHERYPDIPVACEPVENSRFFDRTFDGVLAIGLVFLLSADNQRAIIGRMAAALKPAGGLLFSAPHQTGAWEDMITGLPSLSLGADEYQRLITGAGLAVIGRLTDEGGSCYYEARKPA